MIDGCNAGYHSEIVLAFRDVTLLISRSLMYRLSGSPPRLVSASPPVLPGAFLFLPNLAGTKIPVD